jgi:hypothetical protein
MKMVVRSRLAGSSIALAGLILSAFLGLSGGAARAAEPVLPESVQKAVRRGLKAAKNEEWKLAVHYFGEARKKAPRNPRIIYYMALAHDKAGGRELLAIAWFRAYLALAPESKVTAEVRERVKKLEGESRKTARKLVGIAVTAARQLPNKYSKNSRLASAAEKLALAGDVAGAKVLAEEANSDSARKGIAVAQARHGDWEGAEATLDAIKSASYQSYGYSELVKLKTKAGKYSAARKYNDRLTDSSRRVDNYLYIAGQQINKDDQDGASGTLALCKLALDKLKDDSSRLRRYRSFLGLKVKCDETDEALQLVGRANSKSRPALYAAVAEAQFSIKDSKAARITIGKIDPSHKDSVFSTYAKDRLGVGDIPGALKAITRISSDSSKVYRYGNVMDAQVKAGDLDGAARTVAMIPVGKYITDNKAEAYVKLAKAQLKAGKRREMKKTALEVQGLLGKLSVYEKLKLRVSLGDLWIEAGSKGEANRHLLEALNLLARYRKSKGFNTSSPSGPARLLAKLGRFDEATSMALKIKSSWSRDSALIVIAEELTKAGRYDKALSIAARSGSGYSRDSTIRKTVAALVKAGKLRYAEKYLAAIEKPADREKVYAFLAAGQAGAGDVAGAKKTAAQISLLKSREGIYRTLAGHQAWTGDAKGAIATLQLIKDPDRLVSATSYAYHAARGQGETEAAKLIATNFKAKLDQLPMTAAVKGRSYVAGWRSPRPGLAELRRGHAKTLLAAAELTEAGKILDTHRSLAGTLAVNGDLVGAEEALYRMRWGASVRGGSWDYYYVGNQEVSLRRFRSARESMALSQYGYYVQNTLCTALINAGDTAGSLELAAACKTSERRCQAYTAIASRQLTRGDRTGALSTLALAERAAGEKSSLRQYRRDSALSGLVAVLAKAGQFEKAQDILKQLHYSSNRRGRTLDIARAYAKGGNRKAVERLLKKVKTLVASESDSTRFNACLECAQVSQLLGDRSAARRAASEAARLLSKMEGSSSYSPPAASLARVQALLGDARKARKTAEAIPDLGKKYRAIIAIGRVQAEAGDIEGALKTMAYAERYRTGKAARTASSYALGQVLGALLSKDKIDLARSTAERIDDQERKLGALSQIAYAELKAGKLDAAMSTIAGIPADNVVAVRAYRGFALDALGRGNVAAARSAAAKITDPAIKDRTMADLAQYQAIKGDVPAARKTVAGIAGAEERSMAYCLIAQEELAVAKAAGAKQSCKLALVAAESVKGSYATVRALARVGHLLREAGAEAEAEAVMAKAQAAAGKIKEQPLQVWARRRIAAARPTPGTTGASASGKSQALRELGVKEFNAWTSYIRYSLKREVYKDPEGFLRSVKAKNKDASGMVYDILYNTGYMCNALEKLQGMEKQWAAKRKAVTAGGK